ncbi:hypothetical protein B0H13DRAFT_1652858 [Mycena leptocephala]|nr:hypothetical protein B0H13DRAFT_1655850 [Mycena leptocephala]KAJ7835156.1 hypothetical protein B0H13DRAFT_1652858 [Mycena leptocephala]
MPRKHRALPLRQRYSHDLKRRVIHMSQTLHMSTTETSILLNMPLRVVQRVWQVWNEIGEVARPRTRSGRAPLMSRTAVDMMLGMLEHSPDLYLDEIQEQLSAVHGLDLSLRTICRTLHRLGMTIKKLCLLMDPFAHLIIVYSFRSLPPNDARKRVVNSR